jgi:dihydrolipoamide dehydrogenase
VRVLDNEGALAIPDVPRKLGVVGAGVIGLEMGSVWRGWAPTSPCSKRCPHSWVSSTTAIAKEALKLFTKQGLVIQHRRSNHRREGRQERSRGRPTRMRQARSRT